MRYTHFGEGEYEETESTIQALLKETGRSVTNKIDKNTKASTVKNNQTPETYTGYQRAERLVNVSEFVADQPKEYSLANQLEEHSWSLGGNWKIGATSSEAISNNATLRFKFSAKEVYIVMNGPSKEPVTISLNGQSVTTNSNGGSDVNQNGEVILDGARLYKIILLPKFSTNQLLDIKLPAGTSISAFTYGS